LAARRGVVVEPAEGVHGDEDRRDDHDEDEATEVLATHCDTPPNLYRRRG
jgi:hypothetical protein